ncbi:MAG: hypothetical protein P4L46_23095 [Fimbriimonas sp.]|nr:hypothetical protein [Fimbriimonas sp.]
MKETRTPNPPQVGRSSLAVGVIAVAAVGLVGLVLLGTIGLVLVRAYGARSQKPAESWQTNPWSSQYRTLADSLPASRIAAKALVELSHRAIVRVSENHADKDSSGYFKGYLEFGYSYASARGFDVGNASYSGSESGSFSTLVAPNHMFFSDFRRVKVGQRIVFKEIRTNNLPTLKLTQYNADPYLFVRPVAVQ